MPDGYESVAAEADRIVSGERRETYGHPFDNYTAIADAAKALKIDTNTPRGAALFMIVTKLAREAHSAKRDNLVDICGYAKVVELIDVEQARRAHDADVMVEEMHGGEDHMSVLVRMARSEPARFRAEVWPVLDSVERATVEARLQAF